MTILVTGASGMIGVRVTRALVDAGFDVIGISRRSKESFGEKYRHYAVDLAEKDKLRRIIETNKVDRIIHLAALAHTDGVTDLSWDRYKHINVDCARNIFELAGDRPVLYISTVDVFGFYDGKAPVNASTELHPVSKYGKSKAMAEDECKKLKHYTIFRLSPVYTEKNKRDIQKRYYLKYPNIAYQIGKGTCFEILNIQSAVAEIVAWCEEEPKNDVKIIKDAVPMWTPDYIEAEKAEGRAKFVLHLPQWMVCFGYTVLKDILGENEKTYLLNKAVHPLRSE